MYNSQRLLFDQTHLAYTMFNPECTIPDSFYKKGFAVINNIQSPEKTHAILEQFIAGIDIKKLPVYTPFIRRIQLAKADIIPVCDDSVETSYQALHFDMGQPIDTTEPQLMFHIIGLYFPADKAPSTAKTRALTLRGLLKDKKWGGKKRIEKKLLSYVGAFGDGWDDINTRRLSCFARVIDAVSGTTELANYRDKTMAQWFRDPSKNGYKSMHNEHMFYKLRGLPVDTLEEHIQLKPGQLLVIDNMRTAHGRIGKRNAREIYQFMFGIKDATIEDVTHFRTSLIQELVSK